MAGSNGDELPSVNAVSNGSGRHLSADGGFPEHRAIACIKGVEVALAATGEEQVGGSSQDATIGDVAHLELPFQITGMRVDGAHGTVAGFVSPCFHGAAANGRHWRTRRTAGIAAAGLIVVVQLSVIAVVVGPAGNVEQPGARAE